jgi:uncharacterized coiled-coil DUF342 family protein
LEATIELVDLKNKFKLLKSQSTFYNDEAKRLLRLRNSLNQQISDLLNESKDAKKNRNDLNQKVSELKKERDAMRQQLDEFFKQFEELDSQVRNTENHQSIINMKKQIHQEEWTLQTQKITPAEENAIVERISQIEAKLSQMNDISKVLTERKKVQTDIHSLKIKLKIASDQIHKYSQESQVHHNRMVDSLALIDNEIKAKADDAHQKYLEARSKADDYYTKSQTLIPRINEIMNELGEFHDMKNIQIEKVTEVVQNRVEKAVEKFKAGKRLTLEEFTMLVKRGMV